MNDRRHLTCQTCGRELRADAPEQLCAACLMTAALQTTAAPIDLIPPTEELLVAVEDDKGDDEGVGLPSLEAPREFGGYRLISVLGQGGMGVVYEAEQVATGRRVALKMLGGKFDSPEMRRRFLREGRLAAGDWPNTTASKGWRANIFAALTCPMTVLAVAC